jgi:energy-coupling factor transporter ATP-binding protein EcfA2
MTEFNKEYLMNKSKESQISDANIRNEEPKFKITPTIKGVQKLLKGQEPACAALFAREIFNKHSNDYAGGKATSISIEDTPKTLSIQQWLENVQLLYDSSKIKELTKSEKTPELHGRLVILGLCLLEPELRRQLVKEDIFRSLKEELRNYKFEQILTARGHELYAPPDSVFNQSDNPLEKLEDDLLGRAAFARYLEKRISTLNLNNRAYSIHLYGAWGSGKSTVLNFLKSLLEEDKKWKVVEFNAWRHQHLSPPWWPLIKHVYKCISKDITIRQRIFHIGWRFAAVRLHYLIGIFVFIVLIWAFSLYLLPSIITNLNLAGKLKEVAAFVENIGKILAIFVTIWAGVKAFSQSLIRGSAQAARDYVQVTQDPMNNIKTRFTSLVSNLKNNKRLAIFIDDLDRCRENYVVEFLEGIQTLFKEAPVLFVVAADRTWLNACYSTVYEKLKPMVREPGKQMGTLFLEKAFQFSTPVPGMPDELKEKYWRSLINIKIEETVSQYKEAQKKASNIIAQKETEDEVMHAFGEDVELTFIEQRAIREEAVIRLASPKVIERTEHALKPLASSLGMNPRLMKRLVNAYSGNRALAVLSEKDIDREQLALWTILSMRWPLLAEYLEKHPEKISQIGQPTLDSNIEEELRPLLDDQEVKTVVQGGLSQVPLNEDTVRNCVLLRG